MFDLNSLRAIKISLASPEQIRSWAWAKEKGEVTKPETINYRSQKPEPDGLFCERIFGPVKNYECYCGKYKKSSYAGKVCEKCGVEVTLKAVRRERMGYINLANPCAHIWFAKGSPSKMALTLGITPKELDEVIYFVSRIVLSRGQSSILEDRKVLDEKEGRETFEAVLRDEILAENSSLKFHPKKDSSEWEKGKTYLNNLLQPTQPFDFISVSKYISRYTGAKFGTGAEAVLELLKKIDINAEIEKIVVELKNSGTSDKAQKRIQNLKRLEVLEDFKKSGIKPEWMVLTVIPVIPPDLRPMMQLDGGRYATSDLNDLYRAVIIKNERLKKEIDSHAPEVILMNEKRMLQEAVDALIDNEKRKKPSTATQSNTPLRSLSSTLKGKQGRFRQNLLGKRVDFSGRSVIAVGPDLNMDECGLPREMAVQLFRPFIAHYLINKKDPSAPAVTSLKQADELIARGDPRVYDAIEEIVKDHPVLLNRAPTLHRLGIQAFRPKLIDGKAIRLHPLVCPGFNADFDGDQMAVHVPLSRQAQAEAMTLMLANRNILKPSDGQPICVPSQDMIYGNYYLTLEDDIPMDEMYAADYKKRGEPDMAEKYRSYEAYEGKLFSDPDTAILAYQNGKISLRTRIFVPARTLKKDWLDEKNYDDKPEHRGWEEYAALKHSYLFTTVGKLIFNDIFPSDFPYINFPYDYDAIKNNPRFQNLKKSDLSAYLENNFHHTPLDIFVTMKQAYDAVINAGSKKADEDFDPFREYAKLQPCRAPIEKKGIKMMMAVIFRDYGAEKTANIMDLFKNQGFDYCTKSGLTISLGDIRPLEGRRELYKKGYEVVNQIKDDYDDGYYTDEERHNAVIRYWNNLKDKDMKQKLGTRMDEEPRNPMFMMMKSGARGSTDNYMQLIGMKGCMLDATGREIEVPVTDCYADGLSVSEYFTSTHGTRKNGSDTALKTADSGYLTRRLVDVSHNVVIREEDCHCDHGLMVEALVADDGQKICSLKDRILGRYSMRDIVSPETGEVLVPGNTYIDEDLADKIIASGIKKVEIRSILTCESTDGVCVHCYGRNLATGKIAEIGDVVGIMAAQSIGEPGTQLTLKNFHTGGVAGTKDITTGLPRVQELLEVRNPKVKDEALITEIPGKVVSIRQNGQRTIFTIVNDAISTENKLDEGSVLLDPDSPYASEYSLPDEKKSGSKNSKAVHKLAVGPETYEYRSYPGAVPCVKEGDIVKAGQPLTKGHINPKKLLECTDLTTVRNYIIKEVKAVYSSNGIDIADKHLEIIVRQMTNHLYVVNSGDTDLLPGQRVTDITFTAKNREVFKQNTEIPKPAVATPLILGITKSALDTDSFLSSASFQETTRVLTDASIKGKVDYLRGLKENVMIGKLIPAGTGLKPLLTPEEANKPSDNIPGLDDEEEEKPAEQPLAAAPSEKPDTESSAQA